ncbi:hypothetical protein AMATHDRAFT_66575 [Amanita thiersii Skay4041]|uniref:Major facilitator superfamily (MFS) profile domain-containing protein n=1 Tax=Amanita thiersii Skay4041 TaxID=703135 RepID=A0A2A9NEZ1_9AGAR|nr:hypothetical protein AMATHDRAFT_66575 [Amanita thiersii Skay4041]
MSESTERSPLLSSEDANGHATYGGAAGNDSHVEPESLESVDVQKNYLPFVIPMAVGIFLAAMDGTIVVSSYAAIGSELNQLQNTSWIATAYMLTQTSFQPLYGKLSDIFGRKSCLLSAYVIFSIGSLFCGLSTTMMQLILSRGLAGIGGGGMSTMVSIIMSDVVPLRSRGTWQGVLNIVFATGSATGAPLGGFLADTIGWRWAFLLQVPLAIFAIIAVSIALRLPNTKNSGLSASFRRVDFGGAITLVLCVFFLLFGLDRGGNTSWMDKFTISALIAFIVFGVLFGLIEMEYANEPFAPKRIIVNGTLIAAYLVNFFCIASAMCQIFHVPLFLQAVLGKTASQASLYLISGILGGLFGSLSGGLIMQYTGKYYILTIAAYVMLLLGTITVFISSGTLFTSTTGIVLGLTITSIGNGCGITTSLIALIANAGQEDQAIATAVSYLFRSLGAVVGLSIGSTIVQDVLRYTLRLRLTGEDVEEIIKHVRESLDYMGQLDPQTRMIVKNAYGDAVRATFVFSVTMGACATLSSIFIKEKALSRRRQ